VKSSIDDVLYTGPEVKKIGIHNVWHEKDVESNIINGHPLAKEAE